MSINKPIFTPLVLRTASSANGPQPEHRTADDRILTIPEAAEHVKVNRRRIDSALQTGELRFIDLGPGTRRTRMADLQKWIDAKTTKAIR